MELVVELIRRIPSHALSLLVIAGMIGACISVPVAHGAEQGVGSATQANAERTLQNEDQGPTTVSGARDQPTGAGGHPHVVIEDNRHPHWEFAYRDLRPDPATDIPARVLYKPSPRLPSSPVLQHLEGTTVIRTFFDATGQVQDVVVVKSSGYVALDRAAMQSARVWQIKPGIKDGLPVRGSITAPVTFPIPKH